MCENVKTLNKINLINPKEFKQKYAYSHPVIVTDAMVNWTVRETFNFNYLNKLYGDDSPALENYSQSCGDVSFEKKSVFVNVWNWRKFKENNEYLNNVNLKVV
ncbi:hypothetical protein CHUAL_013132 [Chamberlinius hualienensis]